MTADTVGGVWTYALELAGALGPHGVEVAVATMGAPLGPSQREEAGRISNLEVFEGGFKLEWMEDPWRDVLRAGEWLLELESGWLPDVVHLNGYAHGQLAWRAPAVVVGHSCVLSWWRAVKGEDAPPDWETYKREVSRGIRQADLVIAPTRAMFDALEEHYGPISRGLVIPNCRSAALFPPLRKEDFVLAAGRLWDEAKNVLSLARVAPELSWPVYVAGEDRHPDGGAARFANVRPLGRLPQQALRGWFGRASIYALPARYEPFGLSALEAALAGCALVLGDIASLREVWGDAALFVPPGDTEVLRETLEGLIRDRARRLLMAERARRRASEFGPERTARSYLKAYADVMTGAPEKRKAADGKREALACAS